MGIGKLAYKLLSRLDPKISAQMSEVFRRKIIEYRSFGLATPTRLKRVLPMDQNHISFYLPEFISFANWKKSWRILFEELT